MIINNLVKGLGSLLIVTLLLISVSANSKDTAAQSDFTANDAVENLNFSAAQFSKMINNIETSNGLLIDPQCKEQALCIPRSQNHNKIHMVHPDKWVVGFYPGALWMLLNHADQLTTLTDKATYKSMLAHANQYSELLLEQAKRTDTHDLGFMVDAPLIFAMQNKDVSTSKKQAYQQAIKEAEKNLLNRFSPEQPVMKSWDFVPRMKGHFVDGKGNSIRKNMDLASPWQYPVIVDNMMNIEILLKSGNSHAIEKGFSHVNATMQNHFFYEKTDTKQQRPIAHHVFDYDKMKPGNWQGLGNQSAWARGQAWALYGFAISAIYASEHPNLATKQSEYEAMFDKLYATLAHFTQGQKVPIWDYFASRSDAYEIAAFADTSTARYSRILDLCIEDIDANTLPYQGFAPIAYDSAILAEHTLAEFENAFSPAGEPMLRDAKVQPCGSKPYYLNDRDIPHDSSAAGVFAAGLYRMAGHAKDKQKAAKYERLADEIMIELSNEYRTDLNKGVSYDLGFVLRSATGHLPEGSEINVPIVYGDYFFIEANMRKLQLVKK